MSDGWRRSIGAATGDGVAIEEIERYRVAMATSSRPFSLQEATEW
jgi:hypothetical protein